jgi:hypothetical protein
MSLSQIVSRTRSLIYGSGLGEQPAIVRAAANANEAVSGQILTFDLLANEGAKVKAGRTLAVYDPDTEADAHVVNVLSISTDTVTAINSYLGSPAVVGADSGDLDAALLEQNPLVTNYEIFEAIDTVIANYLWPWVFDVVTATIASPDMVDGQEAVPAEVEEIVSAWQIVGPTAHRISVSTQPWEVHTSVATNGKLACFDWINGSTGYYTYRAKITEADETDTELTQLIALGAAAICLGGTLVETTLESTKKDNAEAVSQRSAVADRLTRDFFTLRQNMSEELGRRGPQQIRFNRG